MAILDQLFWISQFLLQIRIPRVQKSTNFYKYLVGTEHLAEKSIGRLDEWPKNYSTDIFSAEYYLRTAELSNGQLPFPQISIFVNDKKSNLRMPFFRYDCEFS